MQLILEQPVLPKSRINNFDTIKFRPSLYGVDRVSENHLF